MVRATNDPPATPRGRRAAGRICAGPDDPAGEGVVAANGCWAYARISRTNGEWKICNYDGTVTHEGGTKWVYDDTNAQHDAATEKARITACKDGVPGHSAARGGAVTDLAALPCDAGRGV